MSQKDINRVDRLLTVLSRPIRVAIVGEPGSGKTSVLNGILGGRLPPKHLGSSLLPTLVRHSTDVVAFAVSESGARSRLTSKAVTKTYSVRDTAPMPSRVVYQASSKGQDRTDRPQDGSEGARTSHIELGLPDPLLTTVEFLEVPSLADHRPVSAKASALLRSASVALWCTVASQAWKESERRSWTRRYGHFDHAMLIVTFRDALAGAPEEAKLNARLDRETHGLFNARCLVSLCQLKDHEGEEVQGLRRTLGQLVARATERRLEHVRRIVERLSTRTRADKRARRLPASARLVIPR